MIYLSILNLKETIFEGNVLSITIPGEQGELTILPNHVPIISPIKKGVITALVSDKERFQGQEQKHVECSKGILEFSDNKATILL
jgi:F-type H+-transporting ATPase subunit epsilon